MDCSSTHNFLVHSNGVWLITHDVKKDCFLLNENADTGYFRLVSEGQLQRRHIFSIYSSFPETNPLSLSTEWDDGTAEWEFGSTEWYDGTATIKIFSDEEEYKNYRNQNV